VLDEHGEPVYKHKVGEIVLDEQGQPILESSVVVGSEVNLLLADAKYLLTNTIYRDYRANVASTIHTWCSVNLAAIQKLLLEQTKIYYYPSLLSLALKLVLISKRRLI